VVWMAEAGVGGVVVWLLLLAKTLMPINASAQITVRTTETMIMIMVTLVQLSEASAYGSSNQSMHSPSEDHLHSLSKSSD